MSKIIRHYYTWQNLIRDSKILAKKLANLKFDYLVAISRGGLIPAAILGYLLKIKKIQTIGFSHYVSDDQRGKLINISVPHRNVNNSRVLLVDDVVDTGLTMQKAITILRRRKNRVVSAVIHYKSIKHPIAKPDYFVTDTGNIWVVYPWELYTGDK